MALPPNLATNDIISETWVDAVVTMAGGYAAHVADNGQVTTSGTVESVLQVSSLFNAPGGRRYRIMADLTGGGNVAGDIFRFTIRRGATTAGAGVKVGPAYTVPTPAVPLQPLVVVGYDIPPATTGLQYMLGIVRVQGTGTFAQWTATNYQNTLYVEDIGSA